MTDKEVMRFDIDGSYQSSLTPIQWTAVGSLDANGTGFLKMGKEMMTIHADGRITVSEDASPTETAKLVLEAMQGMLQGMLAREYERGVEVYRKAADDLAAENKLLRDSVVKDSLTVQITDSAKIRAAFEDDEFQGVPV